MDVFEVIRKNRCCKSYRPDMPKQEVLARVVEAGLWAPSGMNIQGWDIAVMKGKPRDEFATLVRRSLTGRKEGRETVQPLDATFFADFGGAPVVIAVTIFKYDEPHNLTTLQSGSALMQNLVLAAQAEGLGTCWINEFSHVEQELLAFLDKKDRQLLAITPVGYPAEKASVLAPTKPKVRWLGFD
jgi:nitroreductase